MNKLYFEHIGVGISKAETNLQRVLQRSGLDYSVVKENIYLKDGVLIPGKVAVLLKETGKVFGITGEDYCIVNNSEAFDFAEELSCSFGFAFERAGSYDKNNNAFIVMSNMESKRIKDYVFISNNFSGNGSVTVYITPYIGGEILSIGDFKLSIRHSKNVKDRMFVCKEVVEKCNLANESVAALAFEFSKEDLSPSRLMYCLRELFKSELNSTNIKIERAEAAISYIMDSFSNRDKNKFGGLLAVSDYECNRSSIRETGNPEVYLNRVLNGMPLTKAAEKILRG